MKRNKYPKPPSHLNELGHDFYYRVCQYLDDRGSFVPVDAILIALAGQSYAVTIEYSQKMASGEISRIQTYKSGAENISAGYLIMEKEEKKLQRYLTMLGIGAAARDKIKILRHDSQSNKPNALSKILDRNN